ncbi:MAG: asparagine synthase (glutamine-hydrolyzing) [Acidobacteriota bacterium]
MCGICGVYNYGASESIEESLIITMRDTMEHRGPDDAGVYINKDRRVGLGHRRLSIVDLSAAGRNPMSNETESIWITFNGEIYNHQKFRADMINRGHEYRSRTDTETIIHLYEEHGLDFVRLLEGDFAIAIWDEEKRRLALARDPLGVKPIYYAVAQGRLIFASEIKAILAHPAVERDVDEESLYHYLSFLTTPAPRTLFAGINKLPAGCMLVCDPRGDIKITRYWDAISTEAVAGDEEEAAGELRRLLNESIEKRMMSDVPFGVFLSGGVDSTANVALMAGLMSQVRTFTVGFRDEAHYNELEEARAVARHFKTDHHEIIIGHQELIDFLPQLIFHQDEPIADPVCVPLYYVSKLARESGTIVVQVGEGADEIFCGYRNYTHYLKIYDHLWRHLSRLPAPARRAVSATGNLIYKAGVGGLFPKTRKFAPDLFRRLYCGEELFWSGALFFDETQKHQLLAPAFKARLGGGHISSHSVVREILDRLLSEKPEADQLERMIYLDLKLRLAELLLMRVDKITMATSVEARVPFLDHKLVEFAMRLPRRMKYRAGETKYILKRALRGVVPDRALHRPKQGFGAPINEWMMDRMGDFVEESLMNSGIRRREFFDYDFIRRLIDEHRRGRVNYSFHLWTLLNLSLWYDRWIR